MSENSTKNIHVCLSSAIMGHDPVITDKSTDEAESMASNVSNQQFSGVESTSESEQRNSHQDSSLEANSSANESSASCESTSTTTNEKTSPSSDDDGTKQCLKRNRCLKTLSKDTDTEISTEAEGLTDTSAESRKEQRRRKGGGAISEPHSSTGEDASESNQSSKSKQDTSNEAADSSAPDEAGWSISEDLMLRGMKESSDNLSWADIGKGLNRHKNDVKARWRAIKDQAPAVADTETGKTDTESHHEEKDTVEDAKQSTDSNKKTTAKHKGHRNDKVAQENKEAKKRAAQASQSQMDVLSGEEASSEESVGSPDGHDESSSQAERRRQLRYLRKHIYSDLYAAEIEIEPDEYLSAQDAAILAAIDSRYKRARWLEMQANFFNVTGLMIPLHILRRKCEAAERRAEMKSRDGVERWLHRTGEQDGESDA